ncbi:tRNA (adenosine(37)-N6)-threonylcarbamoyltransferase complex ATPase subunit type 1 TsaE [Rivihabitans pingtungensis]|jgi:tRNA threonylcarbamoyladenosine biosynthesis protein TsaE|uniref:tRNA threonylcarbamoyladenosine biosynthesis protein TsaE n=1 Tax=Rivihabitans pingtungensis TaxID=1054498 RepID=A0A318KNE4_9NEIS|nr:tRNA (adenosine(37)-N6)-threonylcarbamoyltransferase complex ATPase subunit type 1 TsaE [Rivihabitans pingtungensis]PXX77196.1 tRNA threonylcarbamoyladenosine biosynthesis protein TsaE [Rivihabitans pingtungensis]HNX71335.1 tRNA (adenosine(37)-N6)-threonylcarbamoyltransferase complex ATPase subunit type 1 TsaE [Rivihabitans pingtungensis]
MDDSSVWSLRLADEAATLAAGRQLARGLGGGVIVTLHGDLGAGKTTLTRGVLAGLGHVGRVRSPTYTLVEPYELPTLAVYHFDLYRFADPAEWRDAGFAEYFGPHSLCLLEWPEKAQGCLPPADLAIHLDLDGDGRQLTVTALTPRGKQCLSILTTPAAD